MDFKARFILYIIGLSAGAVDAGQFSVFQRPVFRAISQHQKAAFWFNLCFLSKNGIFYLKKDKFFYPDMPKYRNICR